MLTLSAIGVQIAAKRKALGLTQATLARHASVGRSTLDALENGRIAELGYSKVSKILAALGIELRLQEAGSHRPPTDELMGEDQYDQVPGPRPGN
jgi:transcriptional regulator with XRE-family HTH domain